MLGLIGAAAIGLLVGLSLEDDTKERIADDIKNRLYYKMMTGQEEHKPEPVRKPVMTYASYYDKYKAKPEEKEDEPWKKALKFASNFEAEMFLLRIKDFVSQYGTLSIYDLCALRGLSGSSNEAYSVSWETDKYGWTEKMITNESTVKMGVIVLPKPVSLK